MQSPSQIEQSHLKSHPSHSAQISNILKLQHRLKQQFLLKESESVQKSKLRQMIEQQIKAYLACEVRNYPAHGLIIEDDGFGDCYGFVKEVLLLVSKDSKFLMTLMDANEDRELAKKLIYPVVNIIYENLIDGDEFFKDITKIVIQVQEDEMEGKKLSWFKQQVQEQYLHRMEYRHYSSGVARKTLLNIAQQPAVYSIPRLDVANAEQSVKSEYERLLMNYDNKRQMVLEGLPSNQIIDKIKFTTRNSIRSQKMSSFSQNSEINLGGQAWLVWIIDNFMQDILQSVYRMPIGLKLICKCMQLHMSKGQVDRSSVLSRVWKYLFHLYFDALQYPDKFMQSHFATQGRLQALEKLRSVFAKLHNVESQNEHVRKWIFQFVEEVLSLPQQRLLRLKTNESPQRLKSYAVCLSLQQIKALFTIIIKHPECKQLNAKIYNRVVRINQMSDGLTIFSQIKSTKGLLSPDRAYVLFQQLSLPHNLEIDYQKMYHQAYKQNKLKNILRQILVTLEPIQEYLIGCHVKSFTELLHRLESKYQNDDQFKGADKIPIIVKIKYFLWLAKQENLELVCASMIDDYKQRIDSNLELYKNTKVEYLRALQSLKYYLERAKSKEQHIKETELKDKAKILIGQMKFKYCVTSPKSRENQFGNTGKFILPNYQKIIIQNQQSCIHTRGLEVKHSMVDKLHVSTVSEFIQAFCYLQEVRTAVATGQDKVGINTNLFWFLDTFGQVAGKNPDFSSQVQWFKQHVQNLITRKIYELIFPRKPTYKDLALYARIRSLEWLTPTQLKIDKRNSVEQVWQVAKKCIQQMQKSTCTSQKFDSIKEFLRIINGLLFINNEGGTADNIYPMIVYTLIRAKPDRLNSNLNFIQLFTQPGKMLSSQGYCFTSLKSAVIYLENLTQKNVEGVTKEEMEEKIYECEVKLGIPFLRRSKSTQGTATLAEVRQKIDE